MVGLFSHEIQKAEKLTDETQSSTSIWCAGGFIYSRSEKLQNPWFSQENYGRPQPPNPAFLKWLTYRNNDNRYCSTVSSVARNVKKGSRIIAVPEPKTAQWARVRTRD